jgi:hypothetical protein
MVMSSSPGILDGDHYQLEVSVERRFIAIAVAVVPKTFQYER